jgi:hypothetical protein
VPAPRTVIVKFKSSGTAAARAKKIRDLLGPDLEEARPLFPGETERDLAALFEARLTPSASASRAIARLKADSQIEYAHVPAERRPS